jgi:hypothetical protein
MISEMRCSRTEVEVTTFVLVDGGFGSPAELAPVIGQRRRSSLIEFGVSPAPERERLVASAELSRWKCYACGAEAVAEWRERTIYRERETVWLYYCTRCCEFQWVSAAPLCR